jgi:cytochrome c biogenesis protein CcdA/thiol-disulfide isomerase/thioredoxin
MLLLLSASLIAGVLTVLAPCTISLLPVIVGGSLSGGSSLRRAYTVTASLGISVVLFTILLKASTALVDVPQSFWQILSGAIIIGLGLAMLFPRIWDAIPFLGSINRSSNKVLAQGYQKQNLMGDILTGMALGPVFSSCSPTYFLILATVLPRSFAEGVGYLLVYALGLCGGLLVVSLAGAKLLEWLGVASDPDGWLKRAIGALFILLGIAIFFGYDKQLELVAANHFYDVTQIEQKFLAPMPVSAPRADTPAADATTSGQCVGSSCTPDGMGAPASTSPLIQAELAKKAALFPQAPELVTPDAYLNTPRTSSGQAEPITISQFKGKSVVLIDFWTYSCINCQRTLPYVKAWYEKYKDQGLVIIGVHTPEFAFEGVQSNVENALKRFGISYPVVMDNHYQTWNAFQNSYWPRKYLIDIDGYVVYDHAGEGDYDVTEEAIKAALAERAMRLGTTGPSAGDAQVSAPTSHANSPETYFGSSRNQFLGNGTQGSAGSQTLTVPAKTLRNTLYLGGTWDIQPEYAAAQNGASVVYQYDAQDLYFVASGLPTNIEVWQDGALVGTARGVDVGADSIVHIGESRLYHLVHNAAPGVHTLQLKIQNSGLKAFTFTFG